MAGRVDKTCERSDGTLTNGACADGEVVWSWHPLLVSSLRRQCRPDRVWQNLNPLTTVAIKNSLTGESTK
jgi:hypothetical protein